MTVLPYNVFRILILSALAATAFQSAVADDWPQWGGPRRDLVWRETGIVTSLPEDRLPRLWATPIHDGYSGPAVADGRVYVMDRIHGIDRDGVERVLCLDADSGEILWTHDYECTYTIQYPYGPRSTPTCDGDRVYSVGAVGHLCCLDAHSGDVVWSKYFPDDFGTRLPQWGMAAAPLVDGEQLIVLVGGPDALVVSFNKHTGEQLWRALDDRGIGYCPPVIYEFHGRRQLIVWHPTAVSALDPSTGEHLWSVRVRSNAGLTIATPRRMDDRLLVTAFYNGSTMLEVKQNGSAEIIWQGGSADEEDTDGLHGLMCTPILTSTNVYGVCSYGQLRCLDADTGQRVWETFEATGRGRWWNAFLIPHQDRVFIHNEQGELILAELSASGYRELSRSLLVEPTRPVNRRKTIWSHPAFAMRSVFARNDREIVRVNLAAE